MNRKSILNLVLCGSAIVYASPGIAQGQTTSSRDTAATESETDEIIVTARRREESIMSVPAAVSVIRTEDLIKQQIRETRDIQQLAPGLTMIRNAGNANASVFNIRGQGVTSGGGGDPSVLPYTNEVPSSTQIVPIYDMESVQVFKGPQGTLFGATLTGGAVLFTTKRPHMTEVEGYALANIGNYEKRQFQGAISVPVIKDMLAVRIAGDIDRRDGFTKVLNIPGLRLDDRHSESFRVSARFKPSSSFTNDTIFEFYNAHSNGASNVVMAVDLNPPSCPPSSIHMACVFGKPAAAAVLAAQEEMGPRKVILSTPPPGRDLDRWISSRVRTWNLTNITEFDLTENFTLRNIFGRTWSRTRGGTDFDGTPLLGFHTFSYPAPGEKPVAQISEEFQALGTFPDIADIIVGAYYQKNRTRNGRNDRFFGRLAFTQVLLPTERRQKAIYAQATIHGAAFGLDRLSFTAGGRKTWVRTRGRIGTPQEVKAKADAFTYTTSIDFQATDSLLIYAAHRKGFKPGGTNTGLILPPNAQDYLFYAPESVKDVEIGAKSRFDLGSVRGRATLALYRQWYKNIQRTAVINAATSVINNAESASIKGIEFELFLELTRGLNVGALFAYTDPKFTNYVQPIFGDGAITTPVTFLDLSETKFAGVAKKTFTFTASYDLPLLREDLGALALSGAYYRQSGIYTTDANLGIPSARNPGYGIGKARLEWRGVMGSDFDAALYVNNITNNKYKAGGTAAVLFSQGFTWSTYGDPRTYGLELRYSF